jgi:hypothetical protein
MTQTKAVAVLSILSLVGVANAQLVTPPTEAPAKTEPLPLPAEDVTAPANSQPQMPPIRQAPPADVIPPDLKWESLVKKDDKGNLVRLSIPAEAAAIKVNPLLNDEAKKAAAEYLAERREKFEGLVIANLDLVEDLDSDKLLKLDVMDKQQLAWLKNAIKPFSQPVAPGPISTELAKRGVFTILQQKVNQKIAKEYSDESLKDAIKRAESAAGGSMSKIQQVPVILREQAVDETLNVRRELLVEASKNLPAIVAKLGLEGDAAAKANSVAKIMTKDKPDSERFVAMEGLRQGLTVDQRRELLRQTIALRAKK